MKLVGIFSILLLALSSLVLFNMPFVGYFLNFPYIRKQIWFAWYNLMASLYKNDVDVTFMNYGFKGDECMNVKLLPEDKDDEYCANLYYEVLSARKSHPSSNSLNLEGKSILEVGSGRGGGASFVMRYLKPKSVLGVDFSQIAVDMCNLRHQVAGLNFSYADAEALPFSENTFDIVLNVESSHCYANEKVFFQEAYRVLKPGGFFLMADFRGDKKMDALHGSLKSLAWTSVEYVDITANVLSALSADHMRKQQLIRQKTHPLLQRLMGEFSGLEGGWC